MVKETCGRVCEVYSRVVGYYRPVENWNDGKQEEFSDRKYHNVRKHLKSDSSV